MIIRRATAADLPAIRAVAEAAYARYVAPIGKPPAPMVADFAAHVAGDIVWVTTLREVIGYSVLILDGDVPLLHNIAVHPDRQGSGAGRALIETAENYLIEGGHARYRLYTNVVMVESIALYQRLGFVETRRVEEHGFSRVYMEKRLGL